MTLCRHCHLGPVTRPRGLCWSCFYAPGVRDFYAPTAHHAARQGVGLGYRRPVLPTTPTAARPGTPEKVAVLAERARQGVMLFHPLDAGGPCRGEDPDDAEYPDRANTEPDRRTRTPNPEGEPSPCTAQRPS